MPFQTSMCKTIFKNGDGSVVNKLNLYLVVPSDKPDIFSGKASYLAV